MTETMLPAPYKVLVDTPEDGCAEEWCWVPVEYAPTEDAAIALAKAEGVVWGDGLDLVVAGREWMRRDPAFKPYAESFWRNDKDDVNVDYEPWIPCSKWAKTGVELWRLEVTDDA